MKLTILTYIARSGSTLLLNHLSKNQNVFVFPEAGYLGGMLLCKPFDKFELTQRQKRILQRDLNSHYQLKEWPIYDVLFKNNKDKRNIDIFVEVLISYALRHNASGKVYIFKQQFISSLVELIDPKQLSNVEIKLISLVRDVRAIYNSHLLAKSRFPNIQLSTNPFLIAKRWNEYTNRIYNMPEGGNLQIRYEDLLLDINGCLNRINKFIEISEVSKYGKSDSFFFRMSEIDKELHENVNKEINEKRSDAWKEEQLKIITALIEKLTQKQLLDLKYNLMKYSENPLSLWRLDIYYRIKALIKNNRFSNSLS